ncbi:hypothetical protein GCM10027181_32050 [Rheinheimera gaetbuli]
MIGKALEKQSSNSNKTPLYDLPKIHAKSALNTPALIVKLLQLPGRMLTRQNSPIGSLFRFDETSWSIKKGHFYDYFNSVGNTGIPEGK